MRLPRWAASPWTAQAGQPGLHRGRRQGHLAGHLAEVAVGGDHHRVAVLEGQLEGQLREVEHLLRRGRRQHDGVGAAVAEAAAEQLDVRLLGPDVAQPRAAAHHVDDHPRHLGADHVAHPLQHQAEARRGGEGHAGQAGAAAAVHHVDRRHLAHRLDEVAAQRRQQPRHQLRALGGGGDGVAEEVAAARQQRADGRGVGALEDERPPVRERPPLGGHVDRRWPGPGPDPVGHPQAPGLGAGVDAEAAAVALVEVERDRHQPGLRVDLLPRHDAAVRAGLDAAVAPLAVLRLQPRPGPLHRGCHRRPPRPPRTTRRSWHRSPPMASVLLAPGGPASAPAEARSRRAARADGGRRSGRRRGAQARGSGHPTAASEGQSPMRTQPRRSAGSG